MIKCGETRRRCAVALIEAVNNAIFHAHKKRIEKEIVIKIKIEGNRKKIKIEIVDEGRGFDMAKIKPRGIFIMASMMDKVEYKNNRLKMTYGR